MIGKLDLFQDLSKSVWLVFGEFVGPAYALEANKNTINAIFN